MPLKHSKSKEAFSENVAAEMHVGKPQKQAVAIAFAVKRDATKPPKSKLRMERKRHKVAMGKLRVARTSRQRAKHFASFVE